MCAYDVLFDNIFCNLSDKKPHGEAHNLDTEVKFGRAAKAAWKMVERLFEGLLALQMARQISVTTIVKKGSKKALDRTWQMGLDTVKLYVGVQFFKNNSQL